MTTLITDEFQRARTDEQRALRRSHILQVTREMMEGRRLADVSFNEMARQVGLAKSNIMRYFESREAVLLTLLQEEYADWVNDIEVALPTSKIADPIERVAAVLAQTVMARPLLCELLSNLMTVLEHNVTTQEVIPFKVAVQGEMGRLITLVTPYLGEWTDQQRGLFLGEMNACIMHTWALANPSAALSAAYETSSAIRRPSSMPEEMVRETLATLLVGLKYRKPIRGSVSRQGD